MKYLYTLIITIATSACGNSENLNYDNLAIEHLSKNNSSCENIEKSNKKYSLSKASSLYLKATCYYFSGEINGEEILELYYEASDLNSKDKYGQLTFKRFEDMDIPLNNESISTLKQAIKLIPSNLKLYDDLGYVYEQKEQQNKAIKLYQDAVNLKKKKNEEFYFYKISSSLGNLYLKKKEYSKALKYLLFGRERSPFQNRRDSYNTRYIAQAYSGLNNPAKAIEYFKLAITEDSSHYENYHYLAKEQSKSNQCEEAKLTYKIAEPYTIANKQDYIELNKIITLCIE